MNGLVSGKIYRKNPWSSWENLWFPVNFPLNQSIDLQFSWTFWVGLCASPRMDVLVMPSASPVLFVNHNVFFRNFMIQKRWLCYIIIFHYKDNHHVYNHYNINDDFVFFWTNLGRTRVLYCLQHRFKAVLLGSFILATVVQLPSTLCQVISVAHEVQKTLRICDDRHWFTFTL